MKVKSEIEVAQSCLTLSNPMQHRKLQVPSQGPLTSHSGLQNLNSSRLAAAVAAAAAAAKS